MTMEHERLRTAPTINRELRAQKIRLRAISASLHKTLDVPTIRGYQSLPQRSLWYYFDVSEKSCPSREWSTKILLNISKMSEFQLLEAAIYIGYNVT